MKKMIAFAIVLSFLSVHTTSADDGMPQGMTLAERRQRLEETIRVGEQRVKEATERADTARERANAASRELQLVDEQGRQHAIANQERRQQERDRESARLKEEQEKLVRGEGIVMWGMASVIVLTIGALVLVGFLVRKGRNE